MVDLEMVLRRYGDDLDERCPPVTPAVLERHLEALASDDGQPGISVLDVTPEEWRSGSRRRFHLTLAGVAAAVVLLVVLILAGGDNVPESQTFTDVPPPELELPPVEPSEPNPSIASEEVDWDAYFAEIADSSLLLSEEPAAFQLLPGPEPQFDTSALGAEIVLEPVSARDIAGFDEPFSASKPEEGQPIPEGWRPRGPVLFVGQDPYDGSQLAVFRAEVGICTSRFVDDDLVDIGCVSEPESYGPNTEGRWVFVPVDSSVVAISTLEGVRSWQRPKGGWALFDAPDGPEGGLSPEVVAYDAAGNPTGRWGSSRTELDAWAQSHPRPTAEESLALVEAYFDAYNAGDLEAMLSVVPDLTRAPDDTVFTDRGPGGFAVQRLFFDLAQGTILRSPSCTAADGRSDGDTIVTCVYDVLDAPTQAVDATPASTTTVFTVWVNGIREIAESDDSYDGVSFFHVRGPFLEWLRANRPSAICLEEMLELFCDAFTDDFQEPERFGDVDQWTEVGLLVAQYAEEWAAYLELNGCSYLDGC